MRLPVTVHEHRLMALLDSGSTHNFIDVELMRRLHLTMLPNPTM